MESTLIGLIGLVLLLLMILIGIPISFSFFLIGGLGIYMIGGIKALSLMATVPWSWATNFTMMAIPLFVLMGFFTFHSGVSADLYETGYKWLGSLPGGLAMATSVACTGFAAVSGSSMATAAAMGAVAIPEMRKRKYKPSLIGGSIAAGGTAGIMIPPSIGFIVYGLIVEQPIGLLFIAGILPGLLVTVLYLGAIYVHVSRNPAIAPQAPPFSWRERIFSLKNIWGIAILISLVMGGIYGGIFTPTEAAAVGCSGAFILMLARRRLTKQTLRESVLSAVRVTSMLFLIFMGGMVFNVFIALSGLARVIGDVVGSLPLPPVAILGILLITYLPLGCLMDSLALIVLTVPLYIPIFETFGFNLIWIGVLLVRIIEIGLITPPMGLNLFVIKDVAASTGDIPLGEIYRGVVPFLIMDLLSLVILVLCPQISLFLPSTMR